MQWLYEAACRTVRGKKADELTKQLYTHAAAGDKKCLMTLFYLLDYLLQHGASDGQKPAVSLAINLAELEKWDEPVPLALVESLSAGRQATAGDGRLDVERC
jgi:hypothetical protein